MKTGKKNSSTGSTTNRTFTTASRKDWQDPIREVIKLIDKHNNYSMLKRLECDGGFHARQSAILQQYVLNLKTWIKENERFIDK